MGPPWARPERCCRSSELITARVCSMTVDAPRWATALHEIGSLARARSHSLTARMAVELAAPYVPDDCLPDTAGGRSRARALEHGMARAAQCSWVGGQHCHGARCRGAARGSKQPARRGATAPAGLDLVSQCPDALIGVAYCDDPARRPSARSGLAHGGPFGRAGSRTSLTGPIGPYQRLKMAGRETGRVPAKAASG